MKNGVKLRVLLMVLMATSVLVLLAAMESCTASNMIYVPDDYEKIQWAVDNATEGDTITVRDGTYTEKVRINKSHLTIRSENGPANCIVQVSSPQDFNIHAFEITSDYFNISGFTVKGNNARDLFMNKGIYLNGASYCCIENNTIAQHNHGIFIDSCSNNTIISNILSYNNGGGIYLAYSHNNAVTDNTVTNNSGFGISLLQSSLNTISDNIASNDNINLGSSDNNSFSHIALDNGGLFVSDSYHSIVDNSTVNSKPLILLENTSDGVVTDAGQVILINCNNITLKNLDLSNTSVGIELWQTNGCTISTNNVCNNDIGIWLVSSNYNNLTDNIISVNGEEGVYLDDFSNGNTLVNCTIFGNTNGLILYESWGNILRNNSLLDNTYNFGVYGYSIDDYYQDIDISNTVNGKPIRYLVEKADMVLDDSSNAGYVALVSCDNVTVRNLNITNNHQGISVVGTINSILFNNNLSKNAGGIDLRDSNNNTIMNNTIDSNIYEGILLYYNDEYNTIIGNNIGNNGEGIRLCWFSNGNTISDNLISLNGAWGIVMSYSSSNIISANKIFENDWAGINLYYDPNNNQIYNNYFENAINAYDSCNNIWNISITPRTNIIGGSWFGGNYWSDYTGSDTNEDGIGDTLLPYNSSNRIQNFGDWLPLVKTEKPIFDTGPYPSIPGTHNGTITPFYDINVSTLYTYPCPGTGGHTEYAKIWNSTTGWNVTATWNGYTGDWHNISFNKFFTLYANETYNYTIVTGSYPQIHHTNLLNIPTGDTGTIEAPPFTLTSVDGTTFSLSDFRGKVVVLTLIVTTCHLCQGEMGELVQLRQAYPDVAIISVSIDPLETDENLRNFRDNYTADWLFARDTDDVTYKYQGYVLATPTVGVITPKGYISFRKVDVVPLEELKSAIESIYSAGIITCSEFVDINGKHHEGWIPAIRLF